MATVITAGNATNGLKITPDNTGILELKTGTGAGTTALTLNASQNATLAGTLSAGDITSSGLVTGATGALYPIVSGTAQTAPFSTNTRADFSSIPSWVKRITVMLQNVSTSGTSGLLVQIGAGSIDTSGYLSASFQTSSSTQLLSTAGFAIFNNNSNDNTSGPLVLTLFGSNIWQASGVLFKDSSTDYLTITGGTRTLSGTLDRVRVTTVNGTDTFDTGSIINIMWE
jgi:hypothetical protein